MLYTVILYYIGRWELAAQKTWENFIVDSQTRCAVVSHKSSGV